VIYRFISGLLLLACSAHLLSAVSECTELNATSLKKIRHEIGGNAAIIRMVNDIIEPEQLENRALALKLDRLLNAAIKKKSLPKNLNQLLLATSQLGLLKSTETIVEKGGDLNYFDNRSEFQLTPLHLASWCGHLKMVKFLLDSGANPNIDPALPFYGRDYSVKTTTLSLAVHGNDYNGGDIEIVQALIGKNANKCAIDELGFTPYFYILHNVKKNKSELQTLFSECQENN